MNILKRLIAVLIMVIFLVVLVLCSVTLSWVVYWIIMADNLFMIIDDFFSAICIRLGVAKIIKW